MKSSPLRLRPSRLTNQVPLASAQERFQWEEGVRILSQPGEISSEPFVLHDFAEVPSSPTVRPATNSL